jgi:hypothetical protein
MGFVDLSASDWDRDSFGDRGGVARRRRDERESRAQVCDHKLFCESDQTLEGGRQ